MRSKYLTTKSAIRGIAYTVGVPTQEVAQAFIWYGVDVQIMNPNENFEMLDNRWDINPRLQELTVPVIIESKENHPYGWYRKFEKKKR